jgi:hypothetical protein
VFPAASGPSSSDFCFRKVNTVISLFISDV